MSSVSVGCHVEQGGKGCVSFFCRRRSSSVLAAGHSRLMGRQYLPTLSSLPGLWIGMKIALCHISGNCTVEIDR